MYFARILGLIVFSTLSSELASLLRFDYFRILIAGLFVLSSVPLLSDEEKSEIDCDALPESKRALCKLLEQCSFIDDESTRQRCYELALSDDMVDEEGNLLEDLDDVLEWLREDSDAISHDETANETQLELETTDESDTSSSEEETEPRKKRGLLGRLAGALTAPVRAVLPGGRSNSDQTDDSVEQETEEPEGDEKRDKTTRWEATIERVGRVDRNVHLILLDDGKLFEYIANEELRFRKNDKVEVIHVQTWLTEKYRIDGNRGATRDALLIPCHREDLKGIMKRKCELMGLD